ncbi:hypothetical protein [Kitasatospora sp. NPDC085879]|uniref:hypothetical protein n=1 Tax=Kitasatospora sp. NPDC085879 TaxID=3154769 RepID=UPI00342DAF6B
MSVPASATGEPVRSVRAGRGPAVVLWALLVAGLLTLLPCAGTAKAVSGRVPSAPPATAATGPHTAAPASAVHGAGHAVAGWSDEGGPHVWCSADGDHPLPGKGCTSHPFRGLEAQLPNAPPQPVAVTLPQLVPAPALPAAVPLDTLAGPPPAPDLHVLQVHRS